MPSSEDKARRRRHLAVENCIDRYLALIEQEYVIDEHYEQGGDPEFLSELHQRIGAVAHHARGSNPLDYSHYRAELWKFLHEYEEALELEHYESEL